MTNVIIMFIVTNVLTAVIWYFDGKKIEEERIKVGFRAWCKEMIEKGKLADPVTGEIRKVGDSNDD